jgi:hypothetical protein
MLKSDFSHVAFYCTDVGDTGRNVDMGVKYPQAAYIY